MRCIRCKQHISSVDEYCQNCGAKKKWYQKNSPLTIGLLILSLVFLAFCINYFVKADFGGETIPKPTITNKAVDKRFLLNETAILKDLKITATEIKMSRGSEYNKPEEGKVFVGVKFTIENFSNKDQTLSRLMLFDAYADDVKCDLSFTALAEFSEGTLDGYLSPGKKMIGYYPLEIPIESKKLDIEVRSSWLSHSKVKFELAVPQ